MIALLIILYTALVLVLFKVLHLKPSPSLIASSYRRRHPDDRRRGCGVDAVGSHH